MASYLLLAGVVFDYYLRVAAVARRRASYASSLTVTALSYYPIKSTKGTTKTERSSSLLLSATGFVYDRQFMVINSENNNNFITARTHPRLVLVEVEVEAEAETATTKTTTAATGRLIIKAPGTANNSAITVPIVGDVGDGNARARRVTIWGDEVDAIDQGEDAAAFFSTFLNTPGLRLVKLRASTSREANKKYVANAYDGGEKEEGGETGGRKKNFVSFADGYGYLATTEESLEAVKQLVKEEKEKEKEKEEEQQRRRGGDGKEVDMRRFRPNIVISGAPAFEEERWKRLLINGVVFTNIKLCSRCKLTTVDADEGVMAADGQPLRILQKKRAKAKEGCGAEAYFGINLISEEEGKSIAVGDKVTVLDYYSLDELSSIL